MKAQCAGVKGSTAKRINRESSLEVAIDVLNKMGLHTRVESGKILVAP